MAETAPATGRPAIRVHVVEDERDLAEVIRSNLAKEGFDRILLDMMVPHPPATPP